MYGSKGALFGELSRIHNSMLSHLIQLSGAASNITNSDQTQKHILQYKYLPEISEIFTLEMGEW